jgi:hypothetical protein
MHGSGEASVRVAELVKQLASPANEAAQRALAQQEWTRFSGVELLEIVTAFAAHVTASNLLPNRLQADRLRQLLSRFPIDRLDVTSFMDAARILPPHLRATVASILPEALRPALYRRQQMSPTTSPSLDSAQSFSTRAQKRSSLPPSPILRSGPDLDLEYATVLVLSNPDRQDANAKTVARAQLNLRLVESLGELETALLQSNEVCACIVDRSILRTLDLAEQKRLFKRLARYSTFLWIRVDNSGLALTNAGLRRILKNARVLATDIPASAVCVDSDGTIRPTEVDDLKRGHDLLRSHKMARFVVGELSATQAHLLVAAARARMESEGLTGTFEIRSLTTEFLPGGRSGARLATVRVNESRATFVARITNTEAACDEMNRFHRFIRPWDAQLQPELHYHGEDAVILNALVAGDPDRLQPAEMLEDRLSALWNEQWLGCADHAVLERRAEDLASGLERAAKRLAVLNQRQADNSFESAVNPGVAQIEELESRGFNAGLCADAVRARTAAFQRFQKLAQVAVVHGDIHLRNMLVTEESKIHFIDYASAGPGHPALDLVRLELSLYAGQARQFETEAICTELQEALSIRLASLDVLRTNFSNFFQCHVNEVCARTMVAARDAAIDVLHTHGGSVQDYHAAKCLVAWQQLGMIGLHTGLSRAVINSLTREILSW